MNIPFSQTCLLNDWAVLWVIICTVHLIVCFYHVTFEFQNESTFCSLSECQGTPCSTQVPYLKFKWQQRDSNPQPLSVRLRTKWLRVRIPLLSLKLQIWRLRWARSSLTFRQTTECRFILKLVRDMIITYSHWNTLIYFSKKKIWHHIWKLTWKNVWFCFISTVWVHFSLKTEKFRFWKSLKYFNILL